MIARPRPRRSWLVGITLLAAALPSAGSAQPTVGAIERLDPRLDAIVPPGAALEVVAGGIEWAEGPVWDASDGALLLSDVPRNRVLRWTAERGLEVALAPSGYSGAVPFAGREPGSNGLAFDAEGRLVLCQHGDRRIARLEPDGALTTLAERYAGRRLNSPNDLVFAADGGLYFTDPPFGLPDTFDDPGKELPFQGVYRLGPDGRLTLLVDDLRAPNGIDFSPDGRTLYVSSQEADRAVWMAYPVRPDGSVGAGRLLAEAADWSGQPGVADGLVVDRAGHLFAAGPGGVHVFAPDGTRLGILATGVPTGNLAWGEDGLLYIAANHWILRLRTSTGPPAIRLAAQPG